jgi:hypothetical protein
METNNIKLLCGRMKGVIITLGVLLIISILGLTAFIMQMSHNGKLSQINDQLTQQEKKNNELTQRSQSSSQIAATNMKRGDQGPPGVQGPTGPTGGVHAGAGPLLCVGQKKVATPTVGNSPYSIIYLDNRRYTPIQYWTMQNNPDGSVSIVNKFTGNCMTTDNLGSIYSDTCGTPIPITQKFNWGPNMQLSSVSQQNQCLSVDNFSRNTSNSNNSYDLDNLSEKKNSNNGTVSQLKLSPCSASQNLDQTWWIGT